MEDDVPLSKLVTFRFHVVNLPRCIMYHPEVDVGDGLLTVPNFATPLEWALSPLSTLPFLWSVFCLMIRR